MFWNVIEVHCLHQYVGFDRKGRDDGLEEAVKGSVVFPAHDHACIATVVTLLEGERHVWKTLSESYADTYGRILHLTMKQIIENI